VGAALIISSNAPSIILASSFRQANQPIITHQYRTTDTNSTRIVIIPLGAAEQDVAKYYQPDNVTIPNGAAVTWMNHDIAVHTATANDASYTFDTGIIPVGANATVIIRSEQGNIQYYCTIHPWMKGSLTVFPSLTHYPTLGSSTEQTPQPHQRSSKSIVAGPALGHTTGKATTRILLPKSVNTTLGTEQEHKDDWITANHDIFGTRHSSQTIIGEDNVNKLQVKWTLLNEFVIEDPPIIIGNRGFVQDNGGNIIRFDANTGLILWKIRPGTGGNMHGLTYDHGILFSGTGYNATTIAINATNGAIIWQSPVLGPFKEGYNINTPPIVWKDYVIVGSAGGDLPPGKGVVRGNITALNRTNGEVIWNFPTTTGEWVSAGKNPPNGGATAWSGGSLDPQTRILYMPLGNPTPNYNASTRVTASLYANHMVALNITNGKLVWATPFISEGTVLKVRSLDTHDWDTSWGSSVTNVTFGNGAQKKMVIGHDKMGNIIGMNAATGKELWWKTMGRQYHADTIPQPNGSGIVWTYGIDDYHAVDNSTLYVTTNGRGLNFFTNGIVGYKTPTYNTVELGYHNGTITAIDIGTGKIKWEHKVGFPPLVSPLVTNGVVFSGYIPFVEKPSIKYTTSPFGVPKKITATHQIRTGLILALDEDTGQELWKFNVAGPIGVGGPSIGDGMLYVPTGKIQTPKGFEGSVVAFGLP
jgi:outer membrane protein assembly factor BamB/plastocyanin